MPKPKTSRNVLKRSRGQISVRKAKGFFYNKDDYLEDSVLRARQLEPETCQICGEKFDSDLDRSPTFCCNNPNDVMCFVCAKRIFNQKDPCPFCRGACTSLKSNRQFIHKPHTRKRKMSEEVDENLRKRAVKRGEELDLEARRQGNRAVFVEFDSDEEEEARRRANSYYVREWNLEEERELAVGLYNLEYYDAVCSLCDQNIFEVEEDVKFNILCQVSTIFRDGLVQKPNFNLNFNDNNDISYDNKNLLREIERLFKTSTPIWQVKMNLNEFLSFDDSYDGWRMIRWKEFEKKVKIVNIINKALRRNEPSDVILRRLFREGLI